MCLFMRMTVKQENKWLTTQPDMITAYKVVSIDEGKIYPPLYDHTGPYQKTNKLREENIPLERSCYGSTYRLPGRAYNAGYHILYTKEAAIKWLSSYQGTYSSGEAVILKCIIPKKEILTVGLQNEKDIVIVTKEFTFVEGQEYFEEEKQCA